MLSTDETGGRTLTVLDHHSLHRIEVAARWRRPAAGKVPSRHHKLG
jgi:hypothetical protein